MRSELHEVRHRVGTPQRGDRLGCRDVNPAAERGVLQPLAIDAAFEDETVPAETQRLVRRDVLHSVAPVSAGAAPVAPQPSRSKARLSAVGDREDDLFHALGQQLDELEKQQRQLRRLLRSASRRRIDAPPSTQSSAGYVEHSADGDVLSA